MKIPVTMSDLQKHSIFVGTPMFGGNCSGIYTKSMNDLHVLCTQNGIRIKSHNQYNESLIQRARNYVVDEFLQSDFTHLLFIDGDIGFNAQDALAMLALQISNPNKYDVIVAPYAKKTIAWEKVRRAVELGFANENPFDLQHFAADVVFNMVRGTKDFRLDEPLEIAEGGTGFMLIPRYVFEKYAEAHPELSYKPDHIRSEKWDGSREIHAFFHCVIDPETKRYLSEDYFFCQNVRKMGMTVHMCPWMQLMHVGAYVFKSSMHALAALNMSPTADKTSNPKNYPKRLTSNQSRGKIKTIRH